MKSRIQSYFFLVISIILVSVVFLAGCKSGVVTSSSQKSQTTLTASDAQSGTQTSKISESPSSTEQSTTTTTLQSLPENLQKLIDDADKLFKNGEYAEAVSAYRTAKATLQAISSISPDIINKAIEGMEANFEKAKSITDTARIHFGNAMQLEYEKRLEEAIEQLEAALAIYPKYQDAIDALESLKTISKLGDV